MDWSYPQYREHKKMEYLVTLVLLFLLTTQPLSSQGEQSACQIRECQCTTSVTSSFPDVTCFVNAITPYDATVTALPSSVTSLRFSCSNKKISSFFREGIFEKFTWLQSLAVENCNIILLHADSFRGLSNLTSLSITGSSLPPNLDSDTFAHLPLLQNLTITYCELNSLPDIFHLTSLQYLNISNNNLHQLSPEDSTPSVKDSDATGAALLGDLQVVDLSYNNITRMPLNLVERAPALQKLFLIGLGMTQLRIPSEVALRNLIILDARQNPFEHVDFPGLGLAVDMEELRLEGTGNPLYYSGLSQLRRLVELSLINFAINDTIWQELNSTTLARLDLGDNDLSVIDVSRLPTLRTIRLEGNRISSVDNFTFINQPDLLLVNVSHNNISSLPLGLFQYNLNLKALDIGHNAISTLDPQSLYGLSQLFYLDLSHNQLERLSYLIFRDLSSMLFLYLQGNRLTFLPKLSSMTELSILNISDNNLLYLGPADLEGLPKLHSLYASDNKLTVLPPQLFRGNPSLLQAFFQNNQIYDLGAIGAHPKLSIVNLANNQLTDFIGESPFFRLNNLIYLDLDQNKFNSMPLHMFPPSLEFLFINRNELKVVYSTSFEDLPNLRTVQLQMNKYVMSLISVSVNRFGNHEPKPNFYIGGNVFVCDCDLGYLKVIAEDGFTLPVFNNFYPRFFGLDYSSCLTPYEGDQVRPFEDVPLSHFVCFYNESWCDITCQATCKGQEPCEYALTCPVGCECFFGGSVFKREYIHIHCNRRNFTYVPDDIPARAVRLYLDGNSLSHLAKSDFAHLRNTEIIFLNGSGIETVENGTFDNISALVTLRLEDNLLPSVGAGLFGYMETLKKLYLHNNLINSISPHAFSAMPSIETITLHNNKLTVLEGFPKIPSLLFITFGGNPWACSCDVVNINLKIMYALNKVIADRESICCEGYSKFKAIGLRLHTLTVSSMLKSSRATTLSDEERTEDGNGILPEQELSLTPAADSDSRDCLPLMQFSFEDRCMTEVGNASFLYSSGSSGLYPGFIALIIVTTILMMTAASVVAVLWKRKELQAWAFVKLGVRVFDKKAHIDKEDAGSKAFDAFISYSSQDNEFVARTLVPALEEGDRRYRVCVHYRDFPVGRNICDTIFRAIENSSRTILLLSENFLQSEWCRFEFQTAHHHILREGSHRLIIIIVGDIPEEMLDPDLKVHLKSKTYLKYGDPWFWEKLFFALPDVKLRQQQDQEEGRVDVLRGMRILAGEEVVGQDVKGQGEGQIRKEQEINQDAEKKGQNGSPKQHVLKRGKEIGNDQVEIEYGDGEDIEEKEIDGYLNKGSENTKKKEIDGYLNKGFENIKEKEMDGYLNKGFENIKEKEMDGYLNKGFENVYDLFPEKAQAHHGSFANECDLAKEHIQGEDSNRLCSDQEFNVKGLSTSVADEIAAGERGGQKRDQHALRVPEDDPVKDMNEEQDDDLIDHQTDELTNEAAYDVGIVIDEDVDEDNVDDDNDDDDGDDDIDSVVCVHGNGGESTV